MIRTLTRPHFTRTPIIRQQPPRAIHVTSDMIRIGVQTTTTMFTAAVFIYSGLNYMMYRRIRKDAEKKEE